jgi:uncharacterized membrane protein YeaQ/YmgE (transglycosylase-associated protein family)
MLFLSTWIVVGLIAGYLTSTRVNQPGKGRILDMLLGSVVPLVSGGLFYVAGESMPGLHLIGLSEVPALLSSLLSPIISAVALVVSYHALRDGSRRVLSQNSVFGVKSKRRVSVIQ